MSARLIRALLGGLFLACLGLSRSAALALESLPDLRTLTIGETTGKAAGDMLDREAQESQPAAFALWGQRTGETAENADLARSAQVDVVLLTGSSGVLFPSSAPLLRGDGDGCLMDEGTAQALFGSPSPLGCTLSWGGRTLTVRGVVAEDQPLLLAQAMEKDGGLDHLTLRVPEGVGVGKFLGEFQARHGLGGDWERPGDWAGLCGFCSLLPVYVLLLGTVIFLARTGFSVSDSPVRCGVCLLAAGGVWFFMLATTGFSLDIPPELLPGRWSDFDFWGQLAKEKAGALREFVRGEKTCVQMNYLLPALRGCGLGLLAAVLGVIALRNAPAGFRELWWACAGLVFLAFLLTVKVDGALAGDRTVWLCPWAYLGIRAGAERLAGWARGSTQRE